MSFSNYSSYSHPLNKKNKVEMRIFVIVLLIAISAQQEGETHERKHPAIYLIGPAEIRDQLPLINYTIADFGYIPYGHRIFGVLELVAQPDACQPFVLQNTPAGLQSETSAGDGNSHLNRIILAERGNCPFVRKAFNAEHAGAQMLIVIDEYETENVDQVIMVSDHSLQVQIPSVMIGKKEGDQLKKLMQQYTQQPVTIMTKFHMAKSEKVDLQYHMSSLDQSSYLFLTQFNPFYTILASELTFTPFYVIYECKMCRAYNWTLSNEECIGGGRYCAPDPDGAGPVTGRDAVLEDLRQTCVYRTEPTLWWRYMFYFYQNCIMITAQNLTQCSINAVQSAELKPEQVQKCFEDSFENKTNFALSENYILREMRVRFDTNPIMLWPSLYINGMFYKGDLYFENQTTLSDGYYNVSNYASLEAICAGFTRDKQPQLCDNTVTLHIQDNGLVVEKQNPNHTSNILVWVSVIVALIIVLSLLFFLYRRMLRREMHGELQNQVEYALSNYYKMDQSNRARGTSDEV